MTRMMRIGVSVVVAVGTANGAEIWLSAGNNGGAVGGDVVIAGVGGTGQIDLWLDYWGAEDSAAPNGTGWAVAFEGYGQTRDNDIGGPAGLGLAHFQTIAFNNVVSGNFWNLAPNDPDRDAPGNLLPYTFGSVTPGGIRFCNRR